MSLESLVRAGRMLSVLIAAFVVMHIICSVANAYSTKIYIELATNESTRAQYSVPLHDRNFEGRREDTCVPFLGVIRMEIAYDMALWLMGLWSCIQGCAKCLADPTCCIWEYVVILLLAHTIFMCAAQVSTTLPASGGIDECLQANPNGVDQWPWYGVSFVTQSFAGGRACADMIYSGHISVLMILVYGLSTICDSGWRWWGHWLTSLVLGSVASYGIIVCQDHYTVDVVLALGISFLLFTCPPLERLALRWGRINRSVELAVLQGTLRLQGESEAKAKSN